MNDININNKELNIKRKINKKNYNNNSSDNNVQIINLYIELQSNFYWR